MIDSSLTPARPSRGDDSLDSVPVRVDHGENDPTGDLTDRPDSRLAIVSALIQGFQPIRVIEDLDRVDEIDSPLLEIPCGFDRISFEPHRFPSPGKSTALCTVYQSRTSAQTFRPILTHPIALPTLDDTLVEAVSG
jgi:hypothetical protein